MTTQKIQVATILIALIGGAVMFILALNAPDDFPTGSRFEVYEGESLFSISKRLENENIITSALLFRGWVSLLGQDKDIELGAYEFPNRLPLGLVIAKVVNGPDKPLLSVTIPEGYTTGEIAEAFKKAIPTFSIDVFGEIVQEEQLDGFLFPSTYYPLPSFTERNIVDLMASTFKKQYGARFGNESFPKYVTTQREVVSLAAIIEGEANTPEDMKIVSGILQKRLERGMRLQVDVAEVTYEEAGIPDQPINNPGLIAIDAVFHPAASPYLYYITGRDGKMYYAKTFEEHKRNIDKYLR